MKTKLCLLFALLCFSGNFAFSENDDKEEFTLKIDTQRKEFKYKELGKKGIVETQVYFYLTFQFGKCSENESKEGEYQIYPNATKDCVVFVGRAYKMYPEYRKYPDLPEEEIGRESHEHILRVSLEELLSNEEIEIKSELAGIFFTSKYSMKIMSKREGDIITIELIELKEQSSFLGIEL